ncbi:DNA-directed RNA polymerase III subunit RPC7 isoform X1 [Astyanax mexicanus]|uniref:DNA-directed RNA polymerase III subunit RPC7 isoform X1 n=1 Tax=Astyanax mexicanus TaxID=7994 RepID=A0A8T2KQZ9_ASTMX|nr:DNA-directed RNA polymerase III subunit RPC7 isoform X1 [Astyanax mexicanus]
MAGRGRGVAAFTFNIEALGLNRGSMPETQRGPRPMFPEVEFKPVPLKAGEAEDYMLALKQEIRGKMKGLPFNIKPRSSKNNVEKYKEKYVKEYSKICDEEWTPDWNRLPKELMPQKKKIIRKTGACTSFTCVHFCQMLRNWRRKGMINQTRRKRKVAKRRLVKRMKRKLKERSLMKKSLRRRMITLQATLKMVMITELAVMTIWMKPHTDLYSSSFSVFCSLKETYIYVLCNCVLKYKQDLEIQVLKYSSFIFKLQLRSIGRRHILLKFLVEQKCHGQEKTFTI